MTNIGTSNEEFKFVAFCIENTNRSWVDKLAYMRNL